MSRLKKMRRYSLVKGLIAQKIGNKITIFDGEESALYSFNETASFIFQKLKLGWEEERIIQGLVKRYGIQEKIAFDDLNTLTKDLLAKKIITQITE